MVPLTMPPCVRDAPPRTARTSGRSRSRGRPPRGRTVRPSVGLYQVTVEVRPERPLPPTLRFAKPKMDIRRDADETKDSRVEAELFLEHAGAVLEQRLLDHDARQTAAARELQGREQLRFRRLSSFRGIGEVLDEHVLDDE